MGLKNYMSLEIGGKVRGLKFNIGTLKCLQNITGIDPFEFKAADTTFNGYMPYANKIIYAALLSNCLSKKEEPDFSEIDVLAWVDDDLNFQDLTVIADHFQGIFGPPTPSANGEVSKDTQSGQVANV